MSLFCGMNYRLTSVILLIIFAAGSSSVSAQEYLLRYEATHYSSAANVIQHHVITERVSSAALDIAIFEYRLDRVGEAGSKRDSSSLGRSGFDPRLYSSDSLESYREQLIASPTAKALNDHKIEYLGKVDTVVGLPSHMYAITVESVRQYLVWLAEAPPGLENLVLWQTLEYPKRKTSFLAEEELCNMIRLVLLRGFPFPPDNSGKAVPYIITRFDTAVNIDFLTVRNNTYLYDLKSLTREASPGK